MATRGRDLERAFRCFLAFDVLEVGKPLAVFGNTRLRARQDLRAFHVIEDLDDGLGRQYVDVIAGPGGLRATGPGTNEAKVAGIGGNGGRQCAGDCPQGAIEPHLANHQIAVEKVLGQHTQGRQHCKRDRQVIVAAFLGQIGGREIDGQPFPRQREAHGKECRSHPLAALHHRLVGEAHDIELNLARQKLRLDIDRHSLDALEGDRRCMRRHESPRVSLGRLSQWRRKFKNI